MTTLLQDLRYALRQLHKSPGFAVTAVLTLALGIGAATAIFSVVEAVLLRSLPFAHPERLVTIKESVNKLGAMELEMPAPDVLTFQKESRAFEQVGGYISQATELSSAGEPLEVPSARMTASVFPMLGVAPAVGRVFTRQEDEQAQPVAVLGYQLWQTRFHGDPNVLGRKINLDRKPYEVIGVMPRQFEFPLLPGALGQTGIWVPMSFTPEERAASGDNFDYNAVARLKPGVSLEQARQDANRVARMLQAEYPAAMGIEITAPVSPLKEQTVRDARPLLRVLFSAVLLVLLIACANLAGLLLVRAIQRSREAAVRIALGASRGRLLRHAILESLLISITGGICGILLAKAALAYWTALLPNTLPRLHQVTLDASIVLFGLGLAILTGLSCGLAPALVMLHADMNQALKDGGRSSGSGAHGRLRAVLVVAEVAVALTLLSSAGLLLRSFERMSQVDPGFQADHLVTGEFTLPAQRYQTQAQIDTFDRELLTRLHALPGARSAALVSALPMAEPQNERFFIAEGYQPPAGGSYAQEAQAYTLGDYFRTMHIPLLRGRYLKESDTATSPLVIVVSRTLAERYWPDQDPIGRRMKWGAGGDSKMPWITVVGEVADTKQGALDSENRAQAYEPLAQEAASFGPAEARTSSVTQSSMRFALRTALAPEQIEDAVRRTVWAIDSQLALSHVQSMEQAIRATEGPRRFNTTIMTGFAGGAVLLAVLGIYGLISFSVAQRGPEMAIRMALGAERGNVLHLVLMSGLKLAGIGCVLGLIGAALASQLVKSMLFEVTPFDPLVFTIAAATVLLLAMIASWLPARRAANLDPMQALRME
ncbi:MAG: ABC transporter permease [Acidobacteriaceae bacterium]